MNLQDVWEEEYGGLFSTSALKLMCSQHSAFPRTAFSAHLFSRSAVRCGMLETALPRRTRQYALPPVRSRHCGPSWSANSRPMSSSLLVNNYLMPCLKDFGASSRIFVGCTQKLAPLAQVLSFLVEIPRAEETWELTSP